MVARVAAAAAAAGAASPPPAKADGGGAPAGALAAVIAQLRADPSRACFLDGSRAPADHVGGAVRAARVQAALDDAQAASARLSAAVRAEVVLQKEALLAEVDAVAALEKEVATVDAGVQSLASASAALADALSLPYRPMARAVATLANAHAAAAALRTVSRFLLCTQKLADAALFPAFSPAHRTSPESLPAAADAVRELEDMLALRAARAPPRAAADADVFFAEEPVHVDKIDCISKHIPAVRKAAAELRRRTAAMLKSGLAARDQPLMTAAVVAYNALGVLPDRVNSEVGRLLTETQSVLQRSLEPARASTTGGLAFPAAFASARSRAAGIGSSIASGAESLSGGGASDASGASAQRSRASLIGKPGTLVADANPLSAGAASNAASGPGSSSVSEPSWEVWSRIDAMLDTLRDACFKAVLLQQVLSKKYDETTHVSLLHEPIASGFIDAIAKALGEQLSVLARTHRQRASAGQVFRALVADYPRFRTALVALSGRVHALARPSPHPITSFELARGPGSNQLPIIPSRHFIETAFLASASELETYYLSASLERLTGAVASTFESGHGAPGESEALSLVRLFTAELIASRSDGELFATAVANVATALRIYSSNAEDFATTRYPQTSVAEKPRGGPVNVREWPLSRLYNGLVTLTTSGKRVLGSDDEGSGPVPLPIMKEIQNMSVFADGLLNDLFKACTERVTRAMENIHTEDLAGHSGSDDGCSIYAVNVTAQLSMFAEGVVLVLARTPNLGKKTLKLGMTVLDTFVRNASLAFPLPEAARLRLTTDMARVELAVESLCPVRLLGESYLAIRALRRLVFMTDDELVGPDHSENVLETLASLPPSVVAFHLFSRSKDVAFVHPHRREDVAPAVFSSWLDAHSEDEAWSSVERAIEAYEATSPDSPCVEYLALKSLSAPLRKRWTAHREADVW